MNGPVAKSITLGGVAAIACTKNTAVYTDAIAINGCDEFALSIILTGTGAVSVKVEMQQGIVAPAAGNAADANFVVPTGINDIISNLAVKTQVHIALAPLAIQWIRFKLTDLTNVSTDTVAVMNVSLMNRSGF